MALRTNTVEYACATRTTSLATATRHDFAAVTVTIAETASRTIRNAYVEVWARDANTTAASITAWTIGVAIDGGAANDATVTSTIINSGDQQSWCFRRDVTSALASGLTGSSHSVVVGVQINGIATINLAAKLVITYEYDDTGLTTATKTIRIPIESLTGTVGTSASELGTNQVPALTGGSGVLPEASITIRDLFFEVFANEGHLSGTTDDQLFLQIDAEAETGFGALEQALDSTPFMRVFWKRTDLDTTAVHAFRARSLNASRFPQIGAVLVVTYTYNPSTTTTVWNSLLLPLPEAAGAMGGTTSGLQTQVTLTARVEEPATVTLQQSGAILYYNAPNNALAGLNVAVGSQTPRAYTPQVNANSTAGQYSLVHRFDSGGAAGAGITLARGETTINVAWYRTSSVTGTAMNGCLLLNYTSGKATAGIGAHNHTIAWVLQATAAVGTTGVADSAAGGPNLPESSFWVTHVGYDLTVINAGRGPVALVMERLSGESPSDGWEEIATLHIASSNEIATYQGLVASDWFFRHPLDPRPTGGSIKGSRVYRVTSYLDAALAHYGWWSLVMFATYHAQSASLSASVSSYSGDGSGIAVKVHRVDTGEPIYTATTAAGGGYSFTYYDTTTPLFAEAAQDATHVGRSANFTPS
ncbi:MAG: hypothetical protein ACTHU0_21260 [Kofleriaceae bacterium]